MCVSVCSYVCLFVKIVVYRRKKKYFSVIIFPHETDSGTRKDFLRLTCDVIRHFSVLCRYIDRKCFVSYIILYFHWWVIQAK